MCEKEDLKNTGKVDKFVILDLLRKFTGDEQIQIDDKLVTHDEVDYRKLLGEEYLQTGGGINHFLKKRLIRKIVGVVKAVGFVKKSLKKKPKVSRPAASGRKTEKKESKLLKDFIADNKKELKEERKATALEAELRLLDLLLPY